MPPSSEPPDNAPIPPAYSDDGKRLNPTIAALINRGVDSALAKKLKDNGHTLGSLQQLGDAELSALGFPEHAIATMRKGRPSIPDDTLNDLLIANRFTCCVCQDSSRSIIVHHIEEWSVSRSHAPENLAVLCLEHHDKAHQKGGLSINLSPDHLRECKHRWEGALRNLPPGAPLPGAVAQPTVTEAGLLAGPQQAFYLRISDEEIEQSLSRLRQGRFLGGFGFPTIDEAKQFADKVEQAELKGGSRQVRARALAWCARILGQSDTLDRAKELLAKSRELSPTPEGELAAAIILANSERAAGMSKLKAIGTPAAYSAAVRLVTIADGQAEALVWAASAGLNGNSFDCEGKYTYFLAALLSGNWEILFQGPATITDAEIAENAPLLHVMAMTNLMLAVPADIRSLVSSGVPTDPEGVKLSSEPDALAARRRARDYFERFAAFCQSIGVSVGAHLASDYALWLEIRDPQARTAGMARLNDSMRDPVLSLRRLNMAIRYGLKVDLAAIEKRLDQSIAFSGTGTGDEAFARYALIFTQKTSKDVALYIAKHRKQLYAHLQKLAIMGIEVDALAQSGQIDAARERLAEMEAEGLNAKSREELSIVLAEADGKDPLAELRALYDRTGELIPLRNLTGAMEDAGLLEELLPYAEKLFATTHDLHDCFLVAKTLDRLDRYGELYVFLAKNRALVEQSVNLRAMWAWSLWREGKFQDASTELEALADFKTSPSHRALRGNIAISSGNWAALSGYCDEIWADRANQPAEELLHAAELALATHNAHARELVIVATEKAPDEPAVLTHAYTQATKGGWENSPAVSGWIQRAAAKSGSDGPIKMVSMKELFDQKPAWDKQASNVVTELNSGKMPAFLAGELLNRSTLDLTLVPALANPTEVDVRKRSIIYAFSGARGRMPITPGASMAVELGALVTLARLGLLDLVFARFPIVIPHSTLGWLFKERATAIFHQPSRIKHAELLKSLINARAISIVPEPPQPDNTLVRDIGKDLADLLVLAKNQSEAGTPSAVVRSPPIHLVGSLMQEEADLKAYKNLIVSCGAVVGALKAAGALTAQEEAQARAFLQTQEKAWPNEPAVGLNCTFLLDGLSIAHLRTAGVLDKFKTSGLKVSISQNDDDEANALLAMASLTGEELDVIERIRAKLAAGLADGSVRAVRATKADEDRAFQSHPTYTVMALSEPAQYVLVDDRALNRLSGINHDGGQSPIITSLDLLDHLAETGALTEAEVFNHRATLRRCGYQIIPVTEPELRAHLFAADVKEGAVLETAELKAIRESLLRLRMTKLLQIPQEIPALQQTQVSFVRLIREVWLALDWEEKAEARADWLLQLSDIRGWSSAAEPGFERNLAVFGYAQYVWQLASAMIGLDGNVRERYFAWITSRVLDRVKQTEPEVYAWLVTHAKELITSSINDLAAGQS